MKLDRYKQEIVFTTLSSLPGKLGGKTYSDFIKLLTGASRVAIVIATAILTLAYINEAHAATACLGATVGVDTSNGNASRVYSNCGISSATLYITMGVSGGSLFVTARAQDKLNPQPGTHINVGSFSSNKLKNVGTGYEGDCSEIDFSGVEGSVILGSANTTFCGATLLSNGNAIFLRGDITLLLK